MHTGATIIASQPVARITTTAVIQANDVSTLPLLFKESATAAARAARGAVVLETHVRIAQSVDHRQYDRAVHFSTHVSIYTEATQTILTLQLQ